MYDVVALGEVLIDMTPAGFSRRMHPLYEQNPGGAPANVLACLSGLGRRTAMIGKVGDDFFGLSLQQTLLQSGIDCKGLILSERHHTTLAFVHLTPQGERSFTFYRQPGADQTLETSEVCRDLIHETQIFHFGTVSLTGQPSRSATLQAIQQAKQSGALISCDINYREGLWQSDRQARRIIRPILESVTILKVSEEELQFLTGSQDRFAGAQNLLDHYPIQLLLITRGLKGSDALTRQIQVSQPAYAVQTTDTTGAGDAFMGAFLDQLLSLEKRLDLLDAQTLKRYLSFANAAGALTTEHPGAFKAMPSREAIIQCQKSCRLSESFSN